jgi:hypothetical protein
MSSAPPRMPPVPVPASGPKWGGETYTIPSSSTAPATSYSPPQNLDGSMGYAPPSADPHSLNQALYDPHPPSSRAPLPVLPTRSQANQALYESPAPKSTSHDAPHFLTAYGDQPPSKYVVVVPYSAKAEDEVVLLVGDNVTLDTIYR